jgi:hypothetical protein
MTNPVIERGAFFGITLVSLLGNLLLGIGTVEAQALSHVPEVRFVAGSVKTYLDEPAQPGIGAALRIPITSRFSFEPEVLRVAGDRFVSWQILGNVTVALSTNPKVTPYVVAGIGVNRELDKAIDYRATAATWNGGFGVRFAVNDRVSVSPEVRFGLATFPRLTMALGVALGK